MIWKMRDLDLSLRHVQGVLRSQKNGLENSRLVSPMSCSLDAADHAAEMLAESSGANMTVISWKYMVGAECGGVPIFFFFNLFPYRWILSRQSL